ncbi:MAG: hypothetical protein C5S40_04785 [ANME-2 cluster archaeon]|nr:hypothetical protein [ANME-2 cluster archaeon]
MNEKDNETSQASGEETVKLGSGPIPEKESDLPEDKTVTTPNEKPEEDIEVSPKTPEEEEPITTSEEESVEASDEVPEEEPEKEVEVSPKTPEEEEPITTFEEESVEASDEVPEEEPEKEVEVSQETPEEEEEPITTSDEELVEASDEKPEEDIEVSPKTPEEEEPITTSEEESVEASDEEPEKEVEVSQETLEEEEEEPITTSDEELVEASDEKPEEYIEVSTETPEEEEPITTSDEELVEASDEEPKEEVKVLPEIPSKEEMPVKEEIPVEKEPETPSEPVPVIKEKPKEAPPKEVVIINEVEKKPNMFVKNIKRTGFAIVLVILLALVGTMFAWTSGMDDLRDDNTYLIVVVYKDVPQAASIYHTDTKQSDVIEVTELGALSNNKQFFENAKKQHNVLIDRLIIIDMDTFKKLSTEEYIIYEKTDERIYVDEMCSWINGTIYPRPEIQKDDTPSIVKAKILKSWIDHYNDKLISGYDGYSARVILNAYRSGQIIIYPGNSALTIMKYIAVERIFFPID